MTNSSHHEIRAPLWLGEGRLRENESEGERGKGWRGGVTSWGEREAKRGCEAVKLSEAMTVKGVSEVKGVWPTVRAWERERVASDENLIERKREGGRDLESLRKREEVVESFRKWIMKWMKESIYTRVGFNFFFFNIIYVYRSSSGWVWLKPEPNLDPFRFLFFKKPIPDPIIYRVG